MSKIFFDTNLFIYLIEGIGERALKVQHLVERASERRDELLTSTLTLGEILVKPLAAGDISWADRYEKLMRTPGVTLLDFDRAAARVYGRLRQDKSLNAPDAIQLACAASAGCDLFITSDDHLSRRVIPGIHFITSLDRAWL